MHLSQRSLRLGLLLFGVVAMVVAVAAAVLVPSGLLSHAAPRTASAAFSGKGETVTRTVSVASIKALPKVAPANLNRVPHGLVSQRIPHPTSTNKAAAAAVAHTVPHVNGSGVLQQGALLSNFNALSDTDQANANGGQGFEVTPPDQGLCAGYDPTLGNEKVVFEPINSAVQEYDVHGNPLLSAPVPLFTFFNDPFATGDIRCFYDTATSTFFFTEIGFISHSTSFDSSVDVAVFNSKGFSVYSVDTSLGGACFGDQPKIGFDKNALYAATDEFCGPGQNFEFGGLLLGFSKAQLVAQIISVEVVAFGDPTPLTLGGVPVTGQEPAFGGNTSTEYLVNSFPFDAFGNNNAISNQLGFWKVTGDKNLLTATLTGTVISSETYAFPSLGASTGTGAVTCVPFIFPVDCATGLNVLSEQFIEQDDDRMLQVQLVHDNAHGWQLYASLCTALTVGNNPTDVDGAAWFVLNPSTGKVTHQGYVAVAGAYILYPAIAHTSNGTTAMSFTITSPTENPSAAYVVAKSGSYSFGSVTLAAAGAAPHESFSGVQPGYLRLRWGDYSSCELDPQGQNIWCGTEYIPPIASQDPFDNWGTRIWDVAGA